MQTARVSHSLGKWILRDGFGECVESEDVNMRLETTALVDLGGKLLGKTGEVLFVTLTYGVATLNICPYLPRPNAFEGGNKFLHRKWIVATDIDAPEKGDVCIHSDRTRVHVIRHRCGVACRLLTIGRYFYEVPIGVAKVDGRYRAKSTSARNWPLFDSDAALAQMIDD